ncbi:zf-CCHC domain-containing protein [Tanacetum coccineum]
MMHSISPFHVFIPATSAYSFTMHHLASRLPSILHASCMVSYKGDLYKLLLVQVMVAPTIPVPAEDLRDPIEIRADIVHPEPVVAVAFPAAAVVRTLAQHEEAIRGIQGHLLGVPIQEELPALRFKLDIAEAENASLRARIKTMEAVEKVTRNHERLARIGIEQQLAAVQESHRQDREDFRKLKELVTSQHQGNSQVKDNKINLLVQQYEQFTILEEESIDSAFARFNTIITSLKALDEGFSSKNYVRKFLRALHPKWRAKVTAIEESNDLSSLALDELIGNLKVHEVVMEKDFEIYRGKKERVKSIALKAKKEFSDDETLTTKCALREEKKSFRQRDEKKGKSDRKYFRCGDPNHLIGDCPKPSRNKDQKAFIGGSWSDSENDAEDKTIEELVLTGPIANEGYSQNSKADVVLNKHSMKVEESLNVTFDESPPPTKLSPLVDDDVGEKEAIKRNTKVVLFIILLKEEESIEVE